MRRTIDSSNNAAVLGGVRAKNNGRYNGNGRHWETPPEVFGPLHEEFNFTLDPCATPQTAKCPLFMSEAQNGLEQSWAGHRVYMNPPYGREIYAWTRKARLEQAAGVLVVGLLPASTDLAWWHEDVVGHAEVRYIRGRVRFLTDGPYRASGFFASVIVIWRPYPRADAEQLRRHEADAYSATTPNSGFDSRDGGQTCHCGKNGHLSPSPSCLIHGIETRETNDAAAAALGADCCHCGKDGHALNSVNCPVHGRPPCWTIDGFRECPDYANLHADWTELQRKLADARSVLASIAANTCCEKCQEAALVARSALALSSGHQGDAA